MHKVLVSAVCLNLMFHLSFSWPGKCPDCPPGYYKIKDCSFIDRIWVGIQCAKCTICSAAFQEILVPCSEYNNSVCVNKNATMPPTMMTESAVSSPNEITPMWLILTAVSVSVFVVLLLVLAFISWSCTRGNVSNSSFLKTASLKRRPLPFPSLSCETQDSPSLICDLCSRKFHVPFNSDFS